MVITDAYTGLRWGELAGLQWIRTYLDPDPRIEIDKEFGALHEVGGRLELGPPKTPASVRTVRLPPFLVDLLRVHRGRIPTRGSCSPEPAGRCTGARTSAAARGWPPWPEMRSWGGRR